MLRECAGWRRGKGCCGGAAGRRGGGEAGRRGGMTDVAGSASATAADAERKASPLC